MSHAATCHSKRASRLLARSSRFLRRSEAQGAPRVRAPDRAPSRGALARGMIRVCCGVVRPQRLGRGESEDHHHERQLVGGRGRRGRRRARHVALRPHGADGQGDGARGRRRQRGPVLPCPLPPPRLTTPRPDQTQPRPPVCQPRLGLTKQVPATQSQPNRTFCQVLLSLAVWRQCGGSVGAPLWTLSTRRQTRDRVYTRSLSAIVAPTTAVVAPLPARRPLPPPQQHLLLLVFIYEQASVSAQRAKRALITSGVDGDRRQFRGRGQGGFSDRRHRRHLQLVPQRLVLSCRPTALSPRARGSMRELLHSGPTRASVF